MEGMKLVLCRRRMSSSFVPLILILFYLLFYECLHLSSLISYSILHIHQVEAMIFWGTELQYVGNSVWTELGNLIYTAKHTLLHLQEDFCHPSKLHCLPNSLLCGYLAGAPYALPWNTWLCSWPAYSLLGEYGLDVEETECMCVWQDKSLPIPKANRKGLDTLACSQAYFFILLKTILRLV